MKNICGALLVIASCGGVSLGLTSAAHADLIQNGEFTSLTLVNPQPTHAATLATGGQLGYNLNADNWSVANNGYTFVINPASVESGINGQYGNLALYTTGNGGLADVTAPPTGGNILASDGGYSGHLEPITQTITGLTVGQNYVVSFDYAGAQQTGYSGSTTEAWEVGLGGTIPDSSTPNTSILHNASKGFTGWQAAKVDVTASSTMQTLWFLAYGSPNGVPPFTLLSDVSMAVVPAAAPEPSSLIGGGLVLLVLVGSSLRKFRQPKQA